MAQGSSLRIGDVCYYNTEVVIMCYFATVFPPDDARIVNLAYFNGNTAILWDTVQLSLPASIASLAQVFPEESSEHIDEEDGA